MTDSIHNLINSTEDRANQLYDNIYVCVCVLVFVTMLRLAVVKIPSILGLEDKVET